ncbi:hypothetical protein JOF53_000703 [Crossiella equi]|uniref:Uncharacterized protein n=1 Tax=Crossiella equi TaxID=130796 RepID=A0ABS5A6A2_9PSEU|nr:hypothetical protein [Crossiella equi]MBP2471831.1 hypothetical protein [Crossiella equi]
MAVADGPEVEDPVERLTLAAVCTILAALVPGTALAGSPESVTVDPDTAGPGGLVRVKVVCEHSDATAARSPVFTAPVELRMEAAFPGYRAFTGQARISADAPPGQAEVSSTCGSRTVTGPVWVSGTFVVVTPAQGTAGQHVTVQVGCPRQPDPVVSRALALGALTRDPQGHQPWALRATGTVRRDVTPGVYEVSTTCTGVALRTTFVVRAGEPQVKHPPEGGVETGDGSLSRSVPGGRT